MALTVERATLGIRDTRIHLQPGSFTASRQFDRPFGCHVPGMIEIEIGDVPGERLRLDEPGVGILRRVTRDSAGLLDSLAHRVLTKVCCARGAFALTEVHCDPKTPVTLVFDRVDLAQAYSHAEPLAYIGVGFTL